MTDPTPRVGRRALVVGDDDEALAFVAEALNSFTPGFEVATAHGLRQADAWLETFHPDVLFLDLKAPSEAADHLVAKLLSDPRTRHCRVLSVASTILEGAAARTTPAGAPVVLPRPYGLNALLGAVRRLVDH